MKSLVFLRSGSGALLVVCAALAPFVVGLANAAPASGKTSSEQAQVWHDGMSNEVGTIPAARQGPPSQAPRGAEGPIRSDIRGQAGDPSIRDANPLTVNGLWETLPGNVVRKPRTQ